MDSCAVSPSSSPIIFSFVAPLLQSESHTSLQWSTAVGVSTCQLMHSSLFWKNGNDTSKVLYILKVHLSPKWENQLVLPFLTYPHVYKCKNLGETFGIENKHLLNIELYFSLTSKEIMMPTAFCPSKCTQNIFLEGEKPTSLPPIHFLLLRSSSVNILGWRTAH